MRRLASLGTMIVLFGGIRLYRSQESGNPQITVAKPERRGREASVVHYTITNQARLSILLPTFVLGDALYTLDIEHEVPGKGWVALPRHREHIESSYSNPLSVAPGEAYHADLVLPDRMEVSRWVAFPRPPHTIIMRGKFRLRLAYFLGEAEWEGYLSALKRGEQTPAREARLLRKARQAFSEPFELPASGRP